jgi:SAM-dependent methyltransferase
MTPWSSGYVADVEYIPGYYRQQTPPHLALACLLGGVDGRLPGGVEHAHYLELGCGHGVGAMLVAASNPSWQVTAIDYNPAHIAAARSLAHDAQLANIAFIEADLAAFADSPQGHTLRAADVVSLHGVWSWVAPHVRAGILRLLSQTVAPGGLVHVSYNALPAWQGALGFQRLVREAGRRAGTRSDRQVTAGLQTARDLFGAQAAHLRDGGLVGKLVDGLGESPLGYLAHEYMNEHWAPCFHADVVEAFAGAKLDWAGSANLLEAFPDLTMTTGQRAVLERFDDPAMRELVKDSCLPRQLRHDVFVRGARRLSDAARDAALSDVVLTLTVSASGFDYEMDVPAGRAQLGPAFRPMVAALEQGPARIGTLLTSQEGHSNPAELAGVLVGTNQAIPVIRVGAEPDAAATRLNFAMAQRVRSVVGGEVAAGLASVALGAALPATRLDQFVYARMVAGETIADLDRWVEALSGDVAEDKLGRLREVVAHTAEQRLGAMRRAGVL